MAEKILDTRIQLKYDSYTNWSNTTLGEGKGANLVLKKGEVGFCDIPTGSAEATTAPTVLFKVGDGSHKFSELQWASALAADVYDWAKKSQAEFEAWAKGLVPIEVIDNGTGKFVTDVTATNDANGHHITLTRANVAWGDVTSKPEFDTLYKKVQTAKTYSGAQAKTVTKVEQDAQGVVTVTYGDITFPSYEDNNTAHTHSAGSGTKVSASGGTSGDVKVNLNIAMELVDISGVKTIKIYDKDDTAKTAIATLPATDFIKDGMLDDVSYDAATNKLTFTWNTAAGSKTDVVELSDMLDPYTFNAGAKLDVAVNGTAITYSHETITAPSETAGSGRKYLTGVTTDGYGHITGFTTATETDQTIPSASGSAAIATVSNDVVTLKAGAQMAANHTLSNTSGSDITLAKIAKTGNVNDLVQTSGDVLVFNCGTSTTVI